MSIASYLREIGRGHQGSRPLSTEQAHDLMGQLLDGGLTDLEVGAFAIGMRIKGETLDELVGFLEALHERLTPVASDRPVVVMASYNGARRLPNLLPLLACLLARRGVRVLVHGPTQDPGRVTTAAIFEAMGVPPAAALSSINNTWAAQQPAFVPVELLCPALARLLEVRRTIGLRNSGHTMAKMMLPISGAPALRLMSHTHPEFGQLMAAYAERSGAHMMLLRGTEGEAVADARRQPRLSTWLHGVARPEFGAVATEGTLPSLPDLPHDISAAATASFILQLLDDEAAVPPAIARQAELLGDAVAALSQPISDAAPQ